MASVVSPAQVPKGYEGNDPIIEQAFAVKAIQHAEVYFSLCQKLKASTLTLTKHDAKILASFKETFPNLCTKDKLTKFDEDKDIKDPSNRKVWHDWMKSFEGIVDDYNYGTLLRINCKEEYTQENSAFVTRIQFLGIELARNELQLNDWIQADAKKEKSPGTKR